MSEFTGERLVPGEVDADLWNEHISRYAFAVSLCSGRRRVLDAGCGTGYGSKLLGAGAASVLGIDRSGHAIGHATEHYSGPAVRFAAGECEALPVADGSVDLLVAFEVIEHLQGWRDFLRESARVLAPAGLCLISTPNKSYYAESRGDSGPNPFHVHEFELAEFQLELTRVFSHVRIFGQNHGAAISFTSLGSEAPASARLEALAAPPEEAAFLVAVCGNGDLSAVPDFVFVPRAANVLRERETHIRLLLGELAQKDAEHAALVEDFRREQRELEASNLWAEKLNRQTELQGARIVALQEEFAREQALAKATVDRLERERAASDDAFQTLVSTLERELAARTEWAQGLDANIARCAMLLAESQRAVEERTLWAQNVQAHSDELTARLEELVRSRWMKFGRVTRLGPRE